MIIKQQNLLAMILMYEFIIWRDNGNREKIRWLDYFRRDFFPESHLVIFIKIHFSLSTLNRDKKILFHPRYLSR